MISSWTEVYSPFHWGDSVASITLVKLEIVLARSWVAAWEDSSTFGLPLRSLDFTTCPLILNFASGDCRKTLAFRDCVLRFLPLWSVNLSNQYLPWGESWPCLSDSPSPLPTTSNAGRRLLLCVLTAAFFGIGATLLASCSRSELANIL